MLIALSIYAAVVTIIAVYFILLWRAGHEALAALITGLFEAREFRDILRLRQEIAKGIK